MNSFRCAAVAWGLVVTVVCVAWAQEQPKRRPGADKVDAPLLSGEATEKLNLSAEQKDKIAKLEKEFADKVKGADAKYREAVEKAKQDKDRAAFKKAQEDLEEARKVRADYTTKVAAVLDAAQRKKLESAKGISTRPGAVGAAGVPMLLSPAVQERLGLSAEQKEKLATIQKEFESNILKVLNDEQKAKYEQLKKGRRPQE